MFAILGKQVHNGNPKLAKIGSFAILGKQVRSGKPKIAKIAFLTSEPKLAKKDVIYR